MKHFLKWFLVEMESDSVAGFAATVLLAMVSLVYIAISLAIGIAGHWLVAAILIVFPPAAIVISAYTHRQD